MARQHRSEEAVPHAGAGHLPRPVKLRIVSVAFYAGCALFLGWYIQRVDVEVLSGLRVDGGMLALATAAGVGFRYCGVAIWFQILRGLGAGRITGGVDLAFAYAKAWMGRYMPGKVAWVVGKVYFAAGYGIPEQKLAVSAVLEGALQTVVTLIWALIFLFADTRLDVLSGSQKAILAIACGTLLILLTPAVFNGMMGWVYQRVRKQALGAGSHVEAGVVIRGILLYTGACAVASLSFFLFARAIYGHIGVEHLLFVAGCFNLAGAVGTLAIFAPGGIGVREGVQLLLLPLVMPLEVAVVLTVAARLWSLAVDVLFFGMAWGTQMLGRRRSPVR